MVLFTIALVLSLHLLNELHQLRSFGQFVDPSGALVQIAAFVGFTQDNLILCH